MSLSEPGESEHRVIAVIAVKCRRAAPEAAALWLLFEKLNHKGHEGDTPILKLTRLKTAIARALSSDDPITR